MDHLNIESEIISSVQSLSGSQKSDVLSYIKKMDTKPHSQRIYRRRAMKQIKEALLEF